MAMIDPLNYRFTTTTIPIGDLMSRLSSDQFGRCFDDITTQSRLIESLLFRIPIEAVSIDRSTDSSWRIIDGVRRLTAIHRYMADEYPLTGLVHDYQEIEGLFWSELLRSYQRRIKETSIVVHFVDPGTSPENLDYYRQLVRWRNV